LHELTQENADFGAVFELQLIGVISSDVLENIEGHGLQPYLRLHKYVSHKEALKLQRRSQVLLMIEINSDETVGIVPGKVFEYLAAKRPILAIGPKGWDAGSIINECQAGEVFDYQDKTGLKEVILHWFSTYQDGALGIDSKNIEKYSRKALTARLAEIL
jgi:glycosyltransferase involved in cell wall biosynthesis